MLVDIPPEAKLVSNRFVAGFRDMAIAMSFSSFSSKSQIHVTVS